MRFAQEADTRSATTPSAAAQSAFERADRAIAAAPGQASWACARGCAHCCRLKVLVTAAEAARIAEHPATAERLERIAAIASRAKRLSPGEYRRARIRCAFLDPRDECSIYESRPLKCRAHTSTSLPACESVDGSIPMDPWLVRVGQAIHAGLEADGTAVIELHAALLL